MIFVRKPFFRKSDTGLAFATPEDRECSLEIDGTRTDRLRVEAAIEFGVTYEQITPRLRQIFKTLRHSQHYGMGAERFADVLKRHGL